MKKLKNIFLCLLCMFCIVATRVAMADTCTQNQIDIGVECIDAKVTVKTINLNANKTFKFVLSASGTFYVDWGDGSTAETISRNNTTPTEYSHNYTTAGQKIIKFAGLATGYNTTSYKNDKDPSGAAIRFGASSGSVSTKTGGTPTLIAELDGSIGSVFPTLGTADSQKPTFFELCVGCSNLTNISDNLFSGVTTAKKNLFRSVFDKCTSLTSISGSLFSGVSGSAESMFRSAFYNCSSLSVLPGNLFSGINGSAKTMFQYTFYGTSGLTGQYIPPALFEGLHGQTANNMFSNVFANSGLLEACPSGTILYTGYNAYYSSWSRKVSCEEEVVTCTGSNYKDGNACLPCPTGYDYDTQDGKTDITDCKISCPAGKWTGEYQKLDYIEASGTQYIDTGHVITSTIVSADFEISSGVNVSGNIGHFGGNQDVNSGHAVNFKDSAFGLWIAKQSENGIGAGSKITNGGAFNAEVKQLVHYEISGNNRTLTVNGSANSGTFSEGSIISANHYRLFSNGCVGGCNDKMLEGRMHWFKLYENGSLVFDLIPVKRLSDNAVGMYDLVSGQFFGNSGTGDFTAGPVLETTGGSVCENVGIGYYSVASVTPYGSVSQRTACNTGETTLTDTSTSASDCISATGFTVCPAGTYLPANSTTCTTCTAGNWCPGGQLYHETTDQGLQNCATVIGAGWSSESGSSAQTDCYYLVTLDKNGYSGILNAQSGIGCHIVSTVNNTQNAQLKLFYNTECTMPAFSFPAPSGRYAVSTNWTTTTDITDSIVTTIAPVTTTPVITTYYARKTCAANYYKDGAISCSACGSNSSTVVQNAASACTCDTGYTADGTPNGATTSVNGCLEIVEGSVSCNNGYYLPANSNVCAKCPVNNYCPSGTYSFDEINNQGITPCQSGLFAPAGMWESAQCGRVFRVGEKYVYLRSTKKTTPSLNVDIDKDGIPDFFANMSTVTVPMNADFSNLQDGNKLMVNINGSNDVYYIYDDTVSAN